MSEMPPGDQQDDALARALGFRARERAAEQPGVWEVVARGEASADEVAAREGVEVERANAYFQPFDPNETAALVDGVLAGLRVTEKPTETDEPERKVIPLRAEPAPQIGGGSWWVVGGMLLAAAAAIVLWWVWPRAENLGDQRELLATRDPLPEYGLETDGGLMKVRGDPDSKAPLRYRRATSFAWISRPEAKVEGEVAVRGFAFVEGSSAGLTLRLDELVEVADTGAIRIAGTIDQLGLEPGRYTIVLALARPQALPERAEQVAEPTGDEPWQALRLDIVIED